MTAPTKLSPTDVRTAITTFAALLRSHRDVINRLNVYPVPDGDTGTNMTLTVESVVAAFGSDAGEPTMESVCQAIANGSLMGARGNSGVILSQLLRGLVERWRAVVAVTPTLLAESLSRADQLAREAVVRPVEGTILSVAHAAAQGAADATDSLTHLVRSARDRARVALARTPEQLAVLKQAGVVDSGGTGLVLLFDALCHVVAGDPLPVAPPADSIHVHVSEQVVAHPDDAVGQLRYEVMFLLAAPDATLPGFRDVWAGLGDSIAIVGGDGLYNCHIHTNDIGASIEAGLDAGRPRNIRVTDLAEQVIEERWVREADVVAPPVDDAMAPTTAVVAVVVGDGVARIFRSLGVRAVVSGGQSMNPSTEEMVAAVRAVGSTQVVILPNNANIRPVAEQVAGLVDATVRVVPTASIVEGFAALLAYDPAADADHNAIAMAASAAHVVAGEVTRAVRDTWTDVGEVRVGDWIGLSARGVRAVSESVAGAATALLSDLVTPAHELVTIIEGDGSSAANTRRITEFLAERYPSLAVEVHHGGQPLYPYYVGVE
jgi:DAK2 domain fusion protein YloV